jgi:hypothetical protein
MLANYTVLFSSYFTRDSRWVLEKKKLDPDVTIIKVKQTLIKTKTSER